MFAAETGVNKAPFSARRGLGTTTSARRSCVHLWPPMQSTQSLGAFFFATRDPKFEFLALWKRHIDIRAVCKNLQVINAPEMARLELATSSSFHASIHYFVQLNHPSTSAHSSFSAGEALLPFLCGEPASLARFALGADGFRWPDCKYLSAFGKVIHSSAE